MTAPLDAVLPRLRCPVCTEPVHRLDRVVTCGRTHSFDIAKQGYLNLAVGRGGPGTGDTPEMVAARERVVATGALEPVVAAVTAQATALGTDGVGLHLDLAGGTGHYLARVLDQHSQADGLVIDVSQPALRRAARAHPRMAAIGADAWGRLPLGDACVQTVLSVFGPRDGAELQRVLAPGGIVVVAYPNETHLAQLRPALGMPAVGAAKPERLAETMHGLEPVATESVDQQVQVDRVTAADLALMGPAGKTRAAAELRAASEGLDRSTMVTVSVRVQTWRRPSAP